MSITFLHTTDQHIKTFVDLVNANFGARFTQHHISPYLLKHDKNGNGKDTLQMTKRLLTKLNYGDHVVCTSSFLGPIVDKCAVGLPKVLRVDRPMMQQACALGPNVMLVVDEKNHDISLSLLKECAKKANQKIVPQVVVCKEHSASYPECDLESYSQDVVARIKSEFDPKNPPDCIVLAQLSMLLATEKLKKLGPPVLTSPELAIKHIANLECYAD